MNQKMIDAYNYIKANGLCAAKDVLKATGLGPRSGSVISSLSKAGYLLCAGRIKAKSKQPMITLWQINPDKPAPELKPKPKTTKSVKPVKRIVFEQPSETEENTVQPAGYRFRYGQVVVTPAGKGVVTSQQGDRVVVKLRDCRRQAFPLSQCSVA